MSFKEMVKKIGAENKGYVILKEVTKAGIPSAIVSRMVKEGELERAASGVYLLPDYLEDEFYEVGVRYKDLAFARSTALYLQGLTNRRLGKIEVNFPPHFNTTRLTGLVIHYPSDKLYGLGLCEVETPLGHRVKSYDVERCLCDLFFYREEFDAEERAYAVRKVDKKKIDYQKLVNYAKELKVEREIKALMEVIL